MHRAGKLRKFAVALAAFSLSVVALLQQRRPGLRPRFALISSQRFDPGDYSWMRGFLPDANAAERGAAEAISTWIAECFAEDRKRVLSELHALGIADPAVHQSGGVRDP